MEVFDEHQIAADVVLLAVQNQTLIRRKRQPISHRARNGNDRRNLSSRKAQKRQLLSASMSAGAKLGHRTPRERGFAAE
jgi:hypothetical protein